MRVAAFALAFVLGVSVTDVAAQAPPAGAPEPARLRIRAVGGFLGQVAGFPEYPGGPEDPITEMTVLGGSLGVSDWLAAHPRDRSNLDDWLIIAPNNQTSDFAFEEGPGIAKRPAVVDANQAAISTATSVRWFWSDIAEMTPDVVALGPDDFIRSLRARSDISPVAGEGGEAAGKFVRWLRALPIPFLATNVVVRLHRSGLNTTGKGPIHWSLDTDASVPWTSSVTVTLPCSATLAATLDEADPAKPADRTPVPSSLGEKPDTCHDTYDTELTLDGHHTLKPGRRYTLNVTGSVSQELSFQTDELLAPSKSPTKSGLPYAVRCSADAAATCGSSIVVGLVDPNVKSALGAEAWKYTSGKDGREIVFLDPVEVLQAILGEVSEDGHLPIVTVVSALEDKSALDVMAAMPQVRVWVMPQESAMVATAWPEREKTGTASAFSGDLGSSADIDAGAPGSRKFVVRPEWFGETVGVVDVVGTRRTKSGQTYWLLDGDPAPPLCEAPQLTDTAGAARPAVRATAAKCLVTQGWELKPTSGANGNVTYSAVRGTREVPLATEDAYSVSFSTLWSDRDTLGAIMAFAMRRAGESEIAVLPWSAIDDDYLAWISERLEASDGSKTWLSRYMVERVLYQSPRMVRGYVSGADLVTTLKKIVDAEGDPGACIAGLSGACAALDTDHPERTEVNGRRIDPRLTYSVALPDRIAEAQDIPHSEHAPLFDAITSVERGLEPFEIARGGQAPAYPVSVTRRSGYWLLSPLQFGYRKVGVDDPAGSTARSSLPIDFKDAKPSRGFSVKVVSDAALVDAPRWAIRLPASLDYQWNRDLTPNAVHPVSHDTDDFSAGARVDVKLHVLQEARLFGGWFIDGQTSASNRDITPAFDFTTEDGLDATAKAPFTIAVRSPASRYQGFGVGMDIVPTKKLALWKGTDVTVTTGGLNVIWGSSSNVLSGVRVNNENLAMAKGLDDAFGTYFASHRTTFTRDTPIDFDRARVNQNRAQLDGTGDVHTAIRHLKLTWTPLVRYRQYWKPRSSTVATSPLDLDWTLKLALGLKIPLWSKLAVEPMVQRDWVRIQADTDNLFTQLKFEIKVDVPFFVKWGRDGFIR